MKENYEAYGMLMLALDAADEFLSEDLLHAAESAKNKIISKNGRIIICGGFKSGKTLTANRVLNESLLPVQSYISTNTVCLVKYGENYQLACINKNDNVTVERFESAEIMQEAIGRILEKNEGDLKYISIKTPNSWLQDENIELWDMPHVLDTYDARFDLNSLGARDTIIFTVSAQIPFSKDERKLLRDLITTAPDTKILVSVTGIDMLEEDDRERMKTFLHKRIADMILEEAAEEIDPKCKKNLLQFSENMSLYGACDKAELGAATVSMQNLIEWRIKENKVSVFSAVKDWMEDVVSEIAAKEAEASDRKNKLQNQLSDTLRKRELFSRAWEGVLIQEKNSGIKEYIVPVFKEVLKEFPDKLAEVLMKDMASVAENAFADARSHIRTRHDERLEGAFQKVLCKPSGLFTGMQLDGIVVPSKTEVFPRALQMLYDAIHEKMLENQQTEGVQLAEKARKDIIDYVYRKLELIPNLKEDFVELQNCLQNLKRLTLHEDMLPEKEHCLNTFEFELLTKTMDEQIDGYCTKHFQRKKNIIATFQADKAKKPKPADNLYMYYNEERITFSWENIPKISWEKGDIRQRFLPLVAEGLVERYQDELNRWAEELDRQYAEILKQRDMVRIEAAIHMIDLMSVKLFNQIQSVNEELKKYEQARKRCVKFL